MTTLASFVTAASGTYVTGGVTLTSFTNDPFTFSGYVNAVKYSDAAGSHGVGLYLDAYDATIKGLINWSVTNTGGINGGIFGVQFRGTGSLVNSGTVAGSIFNLGNGLYGTGVEFFQAGTLVNSGSINGHVGVYLGEGGLVTNTGRIGSTQGVVGVKLAGVASAVNGTKGVILGTQDGVAEYYAAVNVTNAGTIESLGSTAGSNGTVFAGVLGDVNGGHVTNAATGLILSSGFGVSMAGAAGTVVNAGTISGGAYALHLATGFANRLVVDPGAVFIGRAGGGNPLAATVASTLELAAGATPGTLTGVGSRYVDFADILVDGGAAWVLGAANTIAPGYLVTVSGTLTNQGTISGPATTGAGVTLAGGAVTNVSGARIAGTKYGVLGSGAAGTVIDGGVITGTAGAGVGLKAGGIVGVASGGTITGIKYGVTIGGAAGTVVTGGSIAAGAKGTAVAFAASFANRLEVYPGAAFTGTINGGGTGSTLELGVGTIAGAITSFGSQYLNFGTIALDSGARWSVAGPIPAADTVAFSKGGSGLLNIVNPGSMAGIITGFSPNETIGLTGIIANATGGTVSAGNTLIVTQANGAPIALTFDPTQSFADLFFNESTIGDTTNLSLAARPGPVLAGETPLSLTIDGTGTISAGMLSTTEVGDPASQLTYTLTTPPVHGTIMKSGAPVTTFTQDDINNGLVTYLQNGDSVATDSFAFKVADQYGNSLTGSFPVTVILAKPVITIDTGLTVGVSLGATITSTELQATETGVMPAQLVYKVTAAPKEGSLLDNGTLAASFTQADINNGLVIYGETGGTVTADPFTFALSDPNKNTLTGTFAISVIPTPVLAVDTGLTVAVGNAGTITDSDLLVTETRDTPDQLTYAITIAPLYGELLNNGVPSASFTQADIAAGAITYQQTSVSSGIDSFSFTVTDQNKQTLDGTFRVTVTPKPVLATDAGLTLLAGGTAEITSSLLLVTDTADAPAQLTYTVTTAPADGTLLNNGTPVASFTQDDIDNGLVTYQESGTATADGFSFEVTDPNNGTVSGAFPITIQGTTTTAAAATGVSVASAYLAVLRVPEPGGATGTIAATEAEEINAGQQSETGYVASLIGLDQALYTTEAALVTIDAFYGATPSSSVLTTVAAATSGTSFDTAAELHALGYSDTNVWTILGSGWSADHSSTFFAEYGSLASGSIADYTTLINELYTREFGAAPSAANLANLLADIPGTQALLNGGGNIATPIQVMGGIYGYLLEVGEVYGIGQYGAATNAFLQAAANGTVVYGPELTKEFPTPANGVKAALAQSPPAVDPAVVTIAGSHELIDPGVGNFTVRFLAGAVADTLVLPAAGTDQISGFDPTTDVLDLRSLLAGTGLGLNVGVADLSGYLSVAEQGSDAVLRFDRSGLGGGGTVAVLQGLGGTVSGLESLIAVGAIRIG